MIGGLWKSTSRLALAASAAMFVGGMAMPSAQAADLGGDCCADLEERVAELEATTARKGNRKMSLTVNGQVNRMVLWYDDGHKSNALYGIDNTNSSSRYDFMGEAKVTSSVKIGFEIMIEVEAGGTSSKVSQFDADGKVAGQIAGSAGVKSFTGSNVDSYAGDARRMMFFVEDAKLGRVTVGRYETAGAITTIDLGGISAGASASEGLVNGSFLLRNNLGQYYSLAWTNLVDPSANQARQQLLRYDSQAFMGFIASASIAEEGGVWGAMLRYANEFNGFRIAAGIGYEKQTQIQTGLSCQTNVPGSGNVATTCITGTGAGPANLFAVNPDVQSVGGSLAVMHVPTGLFAQGHYMRTDFDQDGAGTGSSTAGSFWGDNNKGRIPAQQWLIQGGIAKNWFGLGNTAIFGEYSRNNGYGASAGPQAASTSGGVNYNSPASVAGTTAVFGVTNSEVTMYGAGITQTVDSAATELYLNWRHFSADITCNGTGPNCGTAGPTGGGPAQKLNVNDFDAIVGGARVKF